MPCRTSHLLPSRSVWDQVPGAGGDARPRPGVTAARSSTGAGLTWRGCSGEQVRGEKPPGGGAPGRFLPPQPRGEQGCSHGLLRNVGCALQRVGSHPRLPSGVQPEGSPHPKASRCSPVSGAPHPGKEVGAAQQGRRGGWLCAPPTPVHLPRPHPCHTWDRLLLTGRDLGMSQKGAWPAPALRGPGKGLTQGAASPPSPRCASRSRPWGQREAGVASAGSLGLVCPRAPTNQSLPGQQAPSADSSPPHCPLGPFLVGLALARSHLLTALTRLQVTLSTAAACSRGHDRFGNDLSQGSAPLPFRRVPGTGWGGEAPVGGRTSAWAAVQSRARSGLPVPRPSHGRPALPVLPALSPCPPLPAGPVSTPRLVWFIRLHL